MKCLFCGLEFSRITVSKTCSKKCRLLYKTDKTDDCWIWKGAIAGNRYGKLRWETNFYSVHRISYEVFKGKIPEDKIVCHSCDNPRCVNPDHLWLGTAKDNLQDAAKKGRLISHKGMKRSDETRKKISKNHADNRGEKSSRSKLKESQVYEIRELLNQGHTQREMAKKYGVSRSCIENIRYRRRWTHI